MDSAIVTALTLTAVEPVVGAIEGRPVAAIGGSIGCDSYLNTDLRIPAIDERLVFILSAVRDGPLRDVLLPVETWAVDEQSGLVVTVAEGPIPLADLLKRVRSGAAPRPS